MWLIWEFNASCCLQKLLCRQQGFYFFAERQRNFFLCEQEKLHSLQWQIMQPNAHSFGLMIVCLSVGYLMLFQTESYEQCRDTLVLKHISHDVLYTMSNIWFIFMLLICVELTQHPIHLFLSLIKVYPLKKKKSENFSFFYILFCYLSNPTRGVQQKSKKVPNTLFLPL